MALFTKPEDSESGGGPPVSPALRLDSHRGRCSHVGLPEDHGLGASLTAASLSFIIVILIAHPRYSWPLSSEHEDSVQTCVCVCVLVAWTTILDFEHLLPRDSNIP